MIDETAATGDVAASFLDPEVAEEFAESVGVDPTPGEVEQYLRLEGEGTPMTEAPGPDDEGYNPRHARSEEAGETPAQADAEQMESALREGGPLGPADPYAEQRAQQPTEEGPGTSLT